MARISDLETLKKKLNIGKIECQMVWALDNQNGLKGNPLRAFETCLKTICSFEKYKVGRKSYYSIQEIYSVNKTREHRNKVALVGNTNKANKLCIEKDSAVEFVCALLMNKIQYINEHDYRTHISISGWARACGLSSEDEFVQNRLRNLVDKSIEKLQRFEFINVDVKFMACLYGEHMFIREDDFNNYKEKSKICFKNSVGEEISKRYKSYYQFYSLYKWKDREAINKKYWELMNTGIEYVYKVYRLTLNLKDEQLENKYFIRLGEVLWGYIEDNGFEEISINEKIDDFIRNLEQGK